MGENAIVKMAEVISYQEFGDQEQNREAEEIYAYLAAERNLNQAQDQLNKVYAEGLAYGHPSYLKYGLLLFLAIIGDGAAIFLDLTVVGLTIGPLISSITSWTIMAIFWFTGTKQKKAEKFAEELGPQIEALQENIAHATRITVRTAKVLRRLPGTRALGNKTIKSVAGLRRYARKGSWLKYAITALDDIPILDIIPWSVAGVALSYLDEKKSYQNVREITQEAISQTVSEAT